MDTNTAKFYEVLNDLIHRYVPVKAELSSTYPRWYSVLLKSYIIDKIRYIKNWLEFGFPNGGEEFGGLQALLNIRIYRVDSQRHIFMILNTNI